MLFVAWLTNKNLIANNLQILGKYVKIILEFKFMIVVKTKLDEKMQKELVHPALIIELITMIIGIIGLLAYVIIKTSVENANVEYLLIFSIPFVFGLVFYLTVKKQLKKIKNNTKLNIYEFYEDFMNIKTMDNGEDVGTAKIYYKDLVKKKESKNYFFLFINNLNAFPIAKYELTEDDIKEIRKLLNIQEKSSKTKKK